jgi:hypothetical protein
MQRVKVNEKSFEGQPIYVGIDYHKKSWKGRKKLKLGVLCVFPFFALREMSLS